MQSSILEQRMLLQHHDLLQQQWSNMQFAGYSWICGSPADENTSTGCRNSLEDEGVKVEHHEKSFKDASPRDNSLNSRRRSQVPEITAESDHRRRTSVVKLEDTYEKVPYEHSSTDETPSEDEIDNQEDLTSPIKCFDMGYIKCRAIM